MLEAAFLNQVKERGEERKKEGCVGGKKEGNVEEDPAGVEDRKGGALLPGVECGEETEEEADGKDEDAEGDGFIAPVDQDKGRAEDEAEERLGLVGIDREGMMSGVEHLGQRDEVEEECRDGCGDCDVSPAGAVVERCREDRQRGNAVEKNRDSEPKKRHRWYRSRIGCKTLSI